VFAAYPASGGDGQKAPPPGATHALAAFELKTGKILWQRWIDADVMSAPVAVDGNVWAATFSGSVYQFDQASGKIVSAHRSKATSAPVLVAGTMYFSTRRDEGGRAGEALAAVSASGKSGYVANRKSAVYLDKHVQASAAFTTEGKAEDSNNGFGGGAPASANAQAADDLIGQGSVSTLQAHQGSRIVSLPGKNVSTMGDEVVCADSGTGKKLWTVKIDGDAAKEGGSLASAPVAAGNSVLVGTVGGEILQIDADSGKVTHRWKVGSPVRAQPVVQDGWIYAGTADGRLTAIDTGDKTLTGWSQWGGDAARSSVKK
jgi:outer membrane protein assembly factor BamB